MTICGLPASASQDHPAPFWLSIPATAPEPIKSDAEVEFVSDGYFLRDFNCQVTRSSGSLEADKQACRTVIFRAASKPVKAIAPVWLADPVPEGYVAPQSLSSNPPATPSDYPSQSLDKGEQGTVVVRVVVGADGKIGDCSVASSSGYGRIDNAAKLKLCRKLKVTPATLDGTAVASVNFTQVAFYAGE
jgi:protein TonB